MDLNLWLNQAIPEIADGLEKINQESFFKNKTIGFAGKEKVKKVIHHLRSALFPGIYEKNPIDESKVNIFIGNHLRWAAIDLSDLIKNALLYNHSTENSNHDNFKNCEEKVTLMIQNVFHQLLQTREILYTDIEAAYHGDPAARNHEEILLSYPSIEALSIYRLAHLLYQEKVPLIPRIMTEYAHQITGIDIHPGASIGHSFFIDHGTGVVIGETCEIGSFVKIYQGVTLGAKSFELDEGGNPIKGIKRHPKIEDRVVIYSGATILGGDTIIGHSSIIGGNVWLTQSVPPFSRVYNHQPNPTIKQEKNKS